MLPAVSLLHLLLLLIALYLGFFFCLMGIATVPTSQDCEDLNELIQSASDQWLTHRDHVKC